MKTKIVEFGQGKIGIMRTSEQGEDFDSGIAFRNQKKRPIGSGDPSVIGLDTDQARCFLRFHFSNPESAQVLIDDLEIIRDTLRSRAAIAAQDPRHAAGRKVSER